MTPRRNLCVLTTEVMGGLALSQRLGEGEARRAVERCLNRIGRVVESNAGLLLKVTDKSLCVGFERCDSAVLAAGEMLERVASLPPMSGVSLTVHIGVHHGVVEESAQPGGEAVDMAGRLMALARPGEALASGPAVAQLSAATRHFVRASEERVAGGGGLEWPVFVLGGASPAAPAVVQAAPRLSSRLQLRHQQEMLVVEDASPVLLMGRELGNDVVVVDPRASRQHARIERRREGFVLVDQSTNGSFVVQDGEAEQRVRNGEVALSGRGRIGCGFSANEAERDLVYFEVL